jgi:hypothetical protein
MHHSLHRLISNRALEETGRVRLIDLPKEWAGGNKRLRRRQRNDFPP